MEHVIVTRHAGLVEVLAEMGYTGKVISHATPDDVRGKVVLGVLPLHLAAQTALFGEITLNLTPEQRGVELTAQEVRDAMTGISWFVVKREEDFEFQINMAVEAGMQNCLAGTVRQKIAAREKIEAAMKRDAEKKEAEKQKDLGPGWDFCACDQGGDWETYHFPCPFCCGHDSRKKKCECAFCKYA